MRIRRSVTTLAPPTETSSADAALPSSDPTGFRTTPRRCSTTASSSLVCVLNQSPWDVADPSSQLEGGLFSLTGTSIVLEQAIASLSFHASVKLSGDKMNRGDVAAASDKYSEKNENTVRFSPPQGKIRAEKNNTSTVLSSKPQIRSLSVNQPPSTDSHPLPEKTRRRGRSVKTSVANPNEFYYYSGFGPHWGKKRDSVNKRPPPPPTPAAKAVLPVQLSNDLPSRQVEAIKRGIEFVDYDEDEDDEGDAEGVSGGGRKRIKARSLKSLM